MNLWAMIFGIVLVGVISEMYRARLKVQSKLEMSRSRETELEKHIEALEDRLKNLETIVLEQEKIRDFDQSMT